MEITRIKRVSVPVSDQDRAKDFYTSALGFKLLLELPVPMGDNARWIEVAPDGGETSFILGTWFEGMTPGNLFGLMLETEDIAADADALRSSGVEVEGPFDTPFGTQATFSDPDGNAFVLVQRQEAG
ncbi:VOC family protein [Saccharothrix obliqua]|uniref:VOC family protein n=1 Tax=Saccharothrix obliqua TaxID=2861747 RepID=UPI001C5EE47D|nr:VOC family protein [Saccharothrix obliqua]MBW4721445.1 VOC family protein [Saccharothrix obliqua]